MEEECDGLIPDTRVGEDWVGSKSADVIRNVSHAAAGWGGAPRYYCWSLTRITGFNMAVVDLLLSPRNSGNVGSGRFCALWRAGGEGKKWKLEE